MISRLSLLNMGIPILEEGDAPAPPAAITVGNITTVTDTSSTGNDVDETFDHDHDGDALLVFAVLYENEAANAATVDVVATYDDVDVPTVGESEAGLTDTRPRIEALYLEGASAGVNSLNVTMSTGAGARDAFVIQAVSLSNAGAVEQDDSVGGLNNATNRNFDLTIVDADSLIIGCSAAQRGDGTNTPFTKGVDYATVGTDLETSGNSFRDVAYGAQARIAGATGTQTFDQSWADPVPSSSLALEILPA